ncbi:hypothetical protein OEZ86_009395 [Tetradesmus obliquus]|nr:hypothetical protein OEZ86_009395 [Tetradesmus obliquus]
MLQGPDIVSCKQERKLQRQEAKRVARKAAAAAARDKLQTIEAHSSKRFCSGEKYGEVALAPAVLQKVISFLARIEADGVRGPSMAVSDLANAALASWDFYNAAKHGFAALEAQAAQLQVFVHDTSYYSNPASVQPDTASKFLQAGDLQQLQELELANVALALATAAEAGKGAVPGVTREEAGEVLRAVTHQLVTMVTAASAEAAAAGAAAAADGGSSGKGVSMSNIATLRWAHEVFESSGSS